jgi:oligoendopeptidase F
MKMTLRSSVLSAFCVLLASLPVQAQTRDRATTPDRDKWNLTELYSSDEAWKAAKGRLVAELPSLDSFRGTLAQSPDRMLACLELQSRLSKEFSRLFAYASMHSDEDTRVTKYQAMKQEMVQLGSDFGAKTAFVEPEILKMDRKTVDATLALAKDKKFEAYRHTIDDLFRRKAHTGTEGEEKILADAGLVTGTAQTIFGIFSDADFPNPEVTLSDGKKVKLDSSTFSLYRALPNREDRKKVFSTFFGKRDEFRRTFGAQLSGQISRDLFLARARKYSSSLESALDPNAVPVSVYQNLVTSVNANLGTFHRYLNLRKRILGLDALHYYDLYAPLLPGVALSYTSAESQANILAALAPLGTDYVATIKKAFSERWIDLYPSEGKRPGAYSNGGAYDVHPYMLLNYNGKYTDMSTLAHELGHTMQSHYSNKNQPYPDANYPIFVAEVASTFNEALLIDTMLKRIPDDAARLSLLGEYLEGAKGAVFRQTQFAEFELRAHEQAEKGEALTGDSLDALYLEIARKYYGHDKGICTVDDEIKAEWTFIPHFYYNFYVFQYATSFTASQALSEGVLAGDKAATKRYLDFLSAGGSDYPVELLKKAGVDMTTSQPFELTMKKLNRVMDEMEKILTRMKK